LDQVVDKVLTVSSITTFNIVEELAFSPHVVGVGELERPEEVGGLLEVRTNSGNLMNKIFDTDDVVLAKGLLDNRVVMERDTTLVDLTITTLVDQFADGLLVGVTVGNIGLDQLKHLRGSLVKTDKDTVVDLQETEKSKNLAGLGGNVVDTADTDNKHKLLLGRDVVVTQSLGLTTKTDLVLLVGLVLGIVVLGTLEDFTSLGDLGLKNRENVD
jgi:hypothetical protein